jgi:hypothetical protein
VPLFPPQIPHGRPLIDFETSRRETGDKPPEMRHFRLYLSVPDRRTTSSQCDAASESGIIRGDYGRGWTAEELGTPSPQRRDWPWVQPSPYHRVPEDKADGALGKPFILLSRADVKIARSCTSTYPICLHGTGTTLNLECKYSLRL